MCLVIADNFLGNILKRYILRPKHGIRGKCLMCGQCCRQIYLEMSPSQTKSPLFTKLALMWIQWLFNFRYLRTDIEAMSLVFECKSLLPDGKCGDYTWRPGICRNFPLLHYFKEPVFLPGCGYRPDN